MKERKKNATYIVRHAALAAMRYYSSWLNETALCAKHSPVFPESISHRQMRKINVTGKYLNEFFLFSKKSHWLQFQKRGLHESYMSNMYPDQEKLVKIYVYERL